MYVQICDLQILCILVYCIYLTEQPPTASLGDGYILTHTFDSGMQAWFYKEYWSPCMHGTKGLTLTPVIRGPHIYNNIDTSHIYNIGTLLCTLTKSGGQGPCGPPGSYVCVIHAWHANTTKIPSHACSLDLQVWYQNTTNTQLLLPFVIHAYVEWTM
jgi:hypothetical protein